jgi:hypothetical protein
MRSGLFKITKRYFSSSLSSQSTTIPLSGNSNLTRVRVWNSVYVANDGTFRYSPVPYSILKLKTGFKDSNIGHVSVETGQFYASFWPKLLTFQNKLYVQDGKHSDIVSDLRSEERNPDYLVDLETLDINAMKSELEKFKASNRYWLFGPSSFMVKDKAASCSGLAHALLIAGGIGKLVPPGLTIRDWIIVTPNNLCRLVILAKQKEQELKSDNSSRKFKL